MPNRILKESICTSESVDSLSPFEETFFYRLIVNCDDYGRFDARPAILRGRLYPLKERMTLKEIEGALMKLAAVGIVEIYEVDGKPYLQFPAWKVHQQIRATKSKYPDKPTVCEQLKSIDSKCNQEIANVPVLVFENRESINDNRESESLYCAEPQSASTQQQKPTRATKKPKEPEGPTVYTLPLNDGTEHVVTQAAFDKYTELYPAVDVMQELRNMWGWLDVDPARLKTAGKGIKRFITNWLANEQNKGGTRRFAGREVRQNGTTRGNAVVQGLHSADAGRIAEAIDDSEIQRIAKLAGVGMP